MEELVSDSSPDGMRVKETVLRIGRRLTPPEIREHIKLWAEYPVVDAAFHADDTYMTLRGLCDLLNDDSLHHWLLDALPSRPPRPVKDILLDAFTRRDNGRSCFVGRYHGDDPSLLAIDSALRGLSSSGWLSAECQNMSSTGSDVSSLVKSSVDIIGQHYDSGLSLFKSSVKTNGVPPRPTIFSTFAALSSLAMLRNACNALDGFQLDVSSTMASLLSERFVQDKDQYFCARQVETEKPCLSSTAYLHRCFYIGAQQQSSVAHEKPWKTLSERSRATLRFVKDCSDERSGGFLRGPGQNETLSIKYVWYALQVLRALLGRGDIEPQSLAWLQTGQIIEFILSRSACSGFADQEGEVPSLCATRFALHSFKLIESWWRKGYVNGSYASRRMDMLAACSKVPEFVESCYDPALRAFWAFPVKDIPQSVRNGLFSWRTDASSVITDNSLVGFEKRVSKMIRITVVPDEQMLIRVRDSEEEVQLREFETALRYFERHRADIISRYEGNYVAILNDGIIDWDSDRVKLSDRMHDRFGGRHLYMPYVSACEEEPASMGGPRNLL